MTWGRSLISKSVAEAIYIFLVFFGDYCSRFLVVIFCIMGMLGRVLMWKCRYIASNFSTNQSDIFMDVFKPAYLIYSKFAVDVNPS